MSKNRILPAYLSQLKLTEDLSLQLQEYTEFNSYWDAMNGISRQSAGMGNSLNHSTSMTCGNSGSSGSNPAGIVKPEQNILVGLDQSVIEKGGANGPNPVKPKQAEIVPVAKPVAPVKIEKKEAPLVIPKNPVEEKPVEAPRGAGWTPLGPIPPTEEKPKYKLKEEPPATKLSHQTSQPAPTVVQPVERPEPRAGTPTLHPTSILPSSDIRDDLSLAKTPQQSSVSSQNYVEKFNKIYDAEMEDVDRDLSNKSESKLEQLEKENRGLKDQLDEMKNMMKQLMEFQRQQSEQMMMMQQSQLKQSVAAQPIVSEAVAAQPVAPPVVPQPADPSAEIIDIEDPTEPNAQP